jgi:hypothetical protein
MTDVTQTGIINVSIYISIIKMSLNLLAMTWISENVKLQIYDAKLMKIDASRHLK